MDIIRTSDYEEMSRKAADLMEAQLREKPDCVLGLATGSTPVGTYRELVRRAREGLLHFSKAKTVNLDEYVGLPPENEQSYRYFMQKNLFDWVDIKRENTFVPDGMAKDLPKACGEYEALIRSLKGIDLQLLGIGHNGHIGFNEPGEVFEKETHLVNLSERTIKANARFFSSPDEVPRQAVTMGILSIMRARKILLLASGAQKAKIVKEAFFGPITPKVPASVLQLHPAVTLIADAEALKECDLV